MINGDRDNLAKEYMLHVKDSAKKGNILRKIQDLVKNTPNDQDLGKALRVYILSIENDNNKPGS
jgi:hypothetical protein